RSIADSVLDRQTATSGGVAVGSRPGSAGSADNLLQRIDELVFRALGVKLMKRHLTPPDALLTSAAGDRQAGIAGIQ
ncbi:hypothetical protein ACC746_37370, partial [Rhizobium ruizarguesonis]